MALSSTDKKIAVALSGGIDSAVAAALIVQNYSANNTFGVTLKLLDSKQDKENILLAKKICQRLGIRHYTVDGRKIFREKIIEKTLADYSQGLTPNPCVYCNYLIKFGLLMDYILGERRASFLASGHYAQVFEDKGRYKLYSGIDNKKDQAYFLSLLKQKQLSRLFFPLGEMTKEEVRKKARGLGLEVADRPESQDVCFVEKNFPTFLKKNIKEEPGEIVDQSGKAIGYHQGLVYYTIGQRKGIGGGLKKPYYVTGLDQSQNRLIIGEKKALYRNNLIAKDFNWLNSQNIPAELICQAKIRYSAKRATCRFKKSKSNQLEVTFKEDQRAITPGQIIVFYQGKEVLGGAVIAK